ncbi:MAG: asparagine synthase C-terminal domain-containing protein, partial [bacterium]|nr:asparagine synthase C-terminal domain-containing protein [bacterium]
HITYKKMDNLTKSLYIIFHETILPTLLRNYDRYSMANGVEIRMPFMDYRLVTFVFSLPYTSKLRNSYTKSLLRDTMSPYMPDEITWRKWKVGFNSPIVDWIQKDLKDWFLEIVNSKEFLECNLVKDPYSVKSKVELIANKESSDWHLAERAWTELMPFLWERAVIKDWKYYCDRGVNS